MVDDESVKRGVLVVRWSIAIIFVVAIFSVDSPSALFGGAFLGWAFGAVGRYMKPGSSPSKPVTNAIAARPQSAPAATYDPTKWHSRAPPDLGYGRAAAGLVPPDNIYPATYMPEIPKPAKRASRKHRGSRVDKHGEPYGDLSWPPPDYAIEGKELVFSYSDEDGEITDRRVVRWRKSGYATFDAWCLLREEQRTFRIDRVLMWGGG